MTETSTSGDTLPAPTAPRRGGDWWRYVLVAVAAALAVTGIAVGVAVAGDDDPSPASPRFAAMREACQEWAGSHPMRGRGGPDEAWCDDMVAWMAEHREDWDHGMWGR